MSTTTWIVAFICLSVGVWWDAARGLSWPWSDDTPSPRPFVSKCPEECTCESAVMHCAHRRLKAPPKGRWPDIWILHLENNSIQWLAHDSLVSFPELREIHLCLNKLVELDLNVFGLGTPLLASLYATENSIDSVSGSTGRKLPLLSRIDLSRNRLRLPPPLDAIGSAAPSLLELYLAGNPLNSSQEDQDGGGGRTTMAGDPPPPPAVVAPYVPLLRVLDVSDADLKDLSPQALIGVPNVESLNLANNSLTRVGFAIRTLRYLKELDLSHNNMTRIDHAELPKYRRLQYLWLVGNPIKHINPYMLEDTLASVATVDACGTVAACTTGLEDLYAWAEERSVHVYGECEENATRPGVRVARSVGDGGFSW